MNQLRALIPESGPENRGHPQPERGKLGLGNLGRYQPYELDAPYTLVLKLKDEEAVYNASFYPGVERTGDWELTYRSDDLMDIIRAWMFMRRM